MNVENIMMLDDYDIDYSALSDDILGQLALGNELYIATSALNELSRRNPAVIVPVAWQIIVTEHGDYYLQKLAMELLFEHVANSVTKFVHQNKSGLQNDKLVQYANIIQSAKLAQLPA
ncbi:hypothetical protein QUF64_15375 [Anaerolineales bacterium HSG6]|nr:hypothetical protein [Anaerolineales bacterium HSG6]MDM8530896.1 hypothetical protein [Anaerolineales bacterium HSG25]